MGDQIKKNEMGWACGTYGEEEGYIRVLVGKPEGKGHSKKSRPMWDDTQMDI